MPQNRLVLLGSIIMDVIMTVPRLPERGGDMMASSAKFYPGGGFNVLAAARRMGMDAFYGGLIGDGPMGDRIREHCLQEHISYLARDITDADNGFVMALVEPDGERTFVTHSGIESQLKPRDLAALTLDIHDVVYVSGYDLLYPVSGPTILQFLRMQKGAVRVVFDPGPLILDIPTQYLEELTSRAWIVTANRRELMQWTNQESPENAMHYVLQYMPAKSWAVLRDGAVGAWLASAEQVYFAKSRETVAVDTTGAGDTHTGVLIACLSDQERPWQALWMANVAASLSVEQLGPATCPDRQIVEAEIDRLRC